MLQIVSVSFLTLTQRDRLTSNFVGKEIRQMHEIEILC